MKCGGTMAKENGKKTTEEQLKEAFGQWQSAIDTMIEQAENGFMPLLAKVFVLAGEVLGMYERAFTEGIKKDKKE
jgi:hypothetical protein